MSAPREMPLTAEALGLLAQVMKDECEQQLIAQARLALVLAADLERVERERDEAQQRAHAREADWMQSGQDLAACQAQLADAREALGGVLAILSIEDVYSGLSPREFVRTRVSGIALGPESDAALLSARAILARPLDRSALDAMLKEFGERVAFVLCETMTMSVGVAPTVEACAAIVARVLKERSDAGPKGLAERGEGGKP